MSVPLAALLLAGVWCGIAAAGEGDDLVNKGLEQRRTGHDREALELFRRAYEIDHSPRSLAQMGFAEQALGIWADAEAHLKVALASGADPWIRKNQAVLRRSLELVAPHLGTLEIWGSPEGAQVLINGTQVGVLPLPSPLRISVGTAPVIVRAPGFVEVSRVVDVTSGSIGRERFELSRASSSPVAAVPPVSPPRSAQADPTSRDPALVGIRSTGDASGDEPTPAWKRWWFWTAIGAVAVAGGVTAFLLLRPGSGCTEQRCDSLGPGP